MDLLMTSIETETDQRSGSCLYLAGFNLTKLFFPQHIFTHYVAKSKLNALKPGSFCFSRPWLIMNSFHLISKGQMVDSMT